MRWRRSFNNSSQTFFATQPELDQLLMTARLLEPRCEVLQHSACTSHLLERHGAEDANAIGSSEYRWTIHLPAKKQSLLYR